MAEVKEIKEKEVISIDSADIERVKKFRNDFADCTAKMGEVEVELINAEMMIENIKEAKLKLAQTYKDLRGSESTLTKEFKEKYGIGEFNIEEGTFSPSS